MLNQLWVEEMQHSISKSHLAEKTDGLEENLHARRGLVVIQ